MGANKNQKARDSIGKLFQQLTITRVVCVDDQYDHTATFERFKYLFIDLPDERQSIPELQSIPDDPDFLDDNLKIFWENLSQKKRNQIYMQLRSSSSGENDRQYASILKELLQPYDFQELSLTLWRRVKNDLLESSKEIKTLFLFDQDFRLEGGSPTEGIKLIEDILVSENGNTIMCGLLSHTFQPESQQELLEEYTNASEENRDRFVFISKRQLVNDPLDFARSIKQTTLSPMFKQLKKEVADITTLAHEKAFQEVEKVSIYDFEQIIFQSSILEGVWEPDTLFRVFGFYHRAIAREKARVKDELHDIAASIRSISLISTDSEEAPKHRSWKIRRFELYEDEQYINDLYMPIELGDIFEIKLGDEQKQFILIAQPCDLMVRKSGNRKKAVTEVILAEIVNSADLERKDEKGRPIDQDAYYELLYFNEDEKKAFVSFQQKYSVKLFIVDLCAYQQSGKAELNVNQNCAKYVIPTWQKHHEKLVARSRQIIDQYHQLHQSLETLLEDDKNFILSLAMPKILELPTILSAEGQKNLFIGQISLSDASISYNLKRCGRLCQAHSTALLAKFASFFARAAFEHDFVGDKDR